MPHSGFVMGENVPTHPHFKYGVIVEPCKRIWTPEWVTHILDPQPRPFSDH